MFISRAWRWNLAAMAMIYLGSFLLLYARWPLEQAAIKLVGGWMAVAVLGASAQAVAPDSRRQDAGIVYRFLIVSMIFLVSWSVSDDMGSLVQEISFQSAFVGFALAAIGLVRSGMVQEPIQLLMSIMLAYVGFETIFSYLSTSALMTALLAAVSLGMSLIGAYLVAKSPVSPEVNR